MRSCLDARDFLAQSVERVHGGGSDNNSGGHTKKKRKGRERKEDEEEIEGKGGGKSLARARSLKRFGER